MLKTKATHTHWLLYFFTSSMYEKNVKGAIKRVATKVGVCVC